MTKVVLNIRDDKKAESLLSLLRELPFVDTQIEETLKVWDGCLPMLDSPVSDPDFKFFSREELYER
ncbi:MAG: hypothetical protein FWG31_08770 [Oscillospiraceae bacterium]|nr:hypothetical protein [Oscillospiraceae bacterium]